MIFVPGRLPSFSLDAVFGCLLLFEQIECHVAQHNEVLVGISLADPAIIFAKRHIQHPMQCVFNGPMAAPNLEEMLRVVGHVRDEVARLYS